MRLDLFLEHRPRTREFAAIDGEGKVGRAVVTDVLDDHVHVDVGFGDRTENLVGDAGAIGHAEHCEPARMHLLIKRL